MELCGTEQAFTEDGLPGLHYCTRREGHAARHLCPCGFYWGRVEA